MKKFLAAALLLLGVATMARAATIDLQDQSPASVYLTTTTTPSALVFSGPGIVYGVACSTGATTNYVIMRDTGTLNTSSLEVFPKFGLSTSVPQTFPYPKPARITNGLEVNMGATTADAECAVFYRKVRL